ncbi:hypothetical protein KSP39_PZI014893 [Platanthera zijinensis]|uniref:CRIB domain-containing protein n=1 Tax=Platanthera zijinensis TaxID=2320716 RepID=A0AAP0BAX2_9ASPA
MTTRMKGLIRGLRYISNIFDAKEQEMEIGYPTDVKHVAHIGWDGPSIGGPTWMNQFCSAPLEATGGGDRAEVPHFPSSEYILTGELPGLLSPKPLKKPSRRKKSSEKSTERTAVESPKEASRYNQSYRRNSAGESEPSESSRRGQREARHETGDASGAGENHSGEQELPRIPKQSRRRKVTGSSSRSSGGSGSTRSSRSKARANADQSGPQNGGELDPTKSSEGASCS